MVLIVDLTGNVFLSEEFLFPFVVTRFVSVVIIDYLCC